MGGFAETRRLMDYRNPGSMGKQYFLGMEKVLGGSGDPLYPGGQFFNMCNLTADDQMKSKEIQNGRVAMVAMAGIFAQSAVTNEGPWQNVLDHINSSGAENIATNLA